MSKFVVVISQTPPGRAYSDTMTGYFDDLEEAQEFIKAVVIHFKDAKGTISYHEEVESEGK